MVPTLAIQDARQLGEGAPHVERHVLRVAPRPDDGVHAVSVLVGDERVRRRRPVVHPPERVGRRRVRIVHVVLIDPVGAAAPRHADDADPRRVRRIAAELDLVAGPVTVGPEVERGLLVDDQLAFGRDAIREVVTLDDRKLHRAQVSRRHDAVALTRRHVGALVTVRVDCGDSAVFQIPAGRHRRAGDVRNVGQPTQDLVLRVDVAKAHVRRADEEPRLRKRLEIEARVVRVEDERAPHDDRGPAQHGEREPHLEHDHQRILAAVARVRARTGAGLEQLVRVRARYVEGRHEADDDDAHDARDDPEREHSPARLRRDHPLGYARRDVRLEQLVGPEGGQETERESRDGEQSALEEQLGDDVLTRRTERRPQRELPAASQSAGELQVGEIGAGDEEHGEHRADQREVETGEMELPILDRLEEEAGALERFAGRRGKKAEPMRELVDRRLRLLARHAGS